MVGVIGKAIKGFGKALTKKRPKVKTYYRLKDDVDITQFKKSKKHGSGKKLSVWINRESGQAIQEATSGVSLKYKKSGKPFIPKPELNKGALKKGATRVKGWTKLTSPITGGLTGRYIYDKSKSKK